MCRIVRFLHAVCLAAAFPTMIMAFPGMTLQTGTTRSLSSWRQEGSSRGPLHLVRSEDLRDADFDNLLTTDPAQALAYATQEDYLRDTTIDKSNQLYISMMQYFHKLNEWYTIVNSKIKCPFFRRRISDVIDNMAMIGRFLVIRHKSILSDPSFAALLGYEYTVPGCLPLYEQGGNKASLQSDIHLANQEKSKHLSLTEIASVVQKDWLGKHPSGLRGYYLTGKLSSQIYRNDCLFDGPDPDMPVRGLRKYLSAASHLFDQGKSHAQLLEISQNETDRTITVKWLLGGVLMLPWRPIVKDWTGSTTYYLDDEGLIFRHEESWDISVWEAFVSTAFPGVGHTLWGGVLPFLQ